MAIGLLASLSSIVTYQLWAWCYLLRLYAGFLTEIIILRHNTALFRLLRQACALARTMDVPLHTQLSWIRPPLIPSMPLIQDQHYQIRRLHKSVDMELDLAQIGSYLISRLSENHGKMLKIHRRWQKNYSHTQVGQQQAFKRVRNYYRPISALRRNNYYPLWR